MSASATSVFRSPLAKRLVGEYVWPHRRLILLAGLCMLLAAGATAGNALLMRPVMDGIFIAHDLQLLWMIPLAVLGLAILKAAASYGQAVLMARFGQQMVLDMQMALYRHVMRTDILHFMQEGSGPIISRFIHDIQLIRQHFVQVLTAMVRELITLIALVGVMFYQSVELTLMGLVIIPLGALPLSRLAKRMRTISGTTQAQLGQFTAALSDTFGGMRIVKAYGREAYETKRTHRRLAELLRLYLKAARIQAAASPLMEMLAGLAVAGVIAYGGWQVVQGETTAGAFSSFITALLMAYKPMKSLSTVYTRLQEGIAATERLFTVLDQPPTMEDKPGATALQLAPEQAGITFEHVTFSYQEAAETPQALTDISLHIQPGTAVALVGPSGGGKSTLMQMILRFFDPDQGRILLGGQDIRDGTLKSLRQQIAVVDQEATLFEDTVRANIAYGHNEASEESIVQAAKDAAAHDFIRQLPEGYETKLGPNGVQLSGGQRQRIAIARAMVRNAPILLLDEATSALDSDSEAEVQQALARLMQGRTSVIIAHRLSTIRHVDQIYVLDGGKIIEQGSHEALLQQEGLYARFYQQQMTHPPKKAS